MATKCPICGAENEIVNQCGCDKGNLPTRVNGEVCVTLTRDQAEDVLQYLPDHTQILDYAATNDGRAAPVHCAAERIRRALQQPQESRQPAPQLLSGTFIVSAYQPYGQDLREPEPRKGGIFCELEVIRPDGFRYMLVLRCADPAGVLMDDKQELPSVGIGQELKLAVAGEPVRLDCTCAAKNKFESGPEHDRKCPQYCPF